MYFARCARGVRPEELVNPVDVVESLVALDIGDHLAIFAPHSFEYVRINIKSLFQLPKLCANKDGGSVEQEQSKKNVEKHW